MKTLQSYLEGIRVNPARGWNSAYLDILGQPLPFTETEKFLNGVELFGEDIMFEALMATSSQNLSSPNPLSYVLAVARSIWKERLEEALQKDQNELQIERAKKRVAADSAELAERIEQAKKRVDANDSL
jgi:hypothetical protein